MADFCLAVGSYTEDLGFVQGKGQGIVLVSFDINTLKFGLPEKAVPCGPNPSAMVATEDVLYCVNEVAEGGGKQGIDYKHRGQLVSLVFQNSELKQVSVSDSQGFSPCFVCSDASKQFIAVVNYSPTGKGLVIFKKGKEKGDIGDITGMFTPTTPASMAVPSRQESPHLHQVLFWNPSSSLEGSKVAETQSVFVPDLGSDVIHQLFLTTKTGELVENGAFPVPKGTGPRHGCFHSIPSQQNPSSSHHYLLVVGELSNQMLLFSLDTKTGTIDSLLYQVDCFPSTPTTLTSSSGSKISMSTSVSNVHTMAHLLPHPKQSGLFFCSNRGHDCISVLQSQESYAKLAVSQDQPMVGLKLIFCFPLPNDLKCPRYFTFSRDGTLLFVCGQNSDRVTAFKVKLTCSSGQKKENFSEENQLAISLHALDSLFTPSPVWIQPLSR
eukprot:Lithocolla_globosa_v1_NODE_655_length_3500_cov_12.200581.p2 type:complete len:438 gc:universal NODE_655_length_3500_cov_12.200581:2175-3488(+)